MLADLDDFLCGNYEILRNEEEDADEEEPLPINIGGCVHRAPHYKKLINESRL
jgi:hypothetical protein